MGWKTQSLNADPSNVLDRQPAAPYRSWMDRAELVNQMQALLDRVELLGERMRRLQEENRSLRQQQETLSGERAALLVKNEQARTRVEGMILRLKSLEQHT